jgi:hypothetical protein
MQLPDRDWVDHALHAAAEARLSQPEIPSTTRKISNLEDVH